MKQALLIALGLLVASAAGEARAEGAAVPRVVVISTKSGGSRAKASPDSSQSWVQLIDYAADAYSYELSRDPAAPRPVTVDQILATSGADFVLRASARPGYAELCSTKGVIAEMKSPEPSLDRPDEAALAIGEGLGYQGIVEKIDGKFAVVAAPSAVLREGAQGLVIDASSAHLALRGLSLSPKGIVDVRTVQEGRARVAYMPLKQGIALTVGDKVLFRVDR